MFIDRKVFNNLGFSLFGVLAVAVVVGRLFVHEAVKNFDQLLVATLFEVTEVVNRWRLVLD